jgi:hypothetical protein
MTAKNGQKKSLDFNYFDFGRGSGRSAVFSTAPTPFHWRPKSTAIPRQGSL